MRVGIRRLLHTGFVLAGLFMVAAPSWGGGAGHLDVDFGNGGIRFTDFDDGLDEAHDIVRYPPRKLAVVGRTRNAGGEDFGVVRYRRNGALDQTFGGDGRVTTDFFGDTDSAFAVAVRPNGKILAVGKAEGDNGLSRFALAQYRPGGALDDSFGGDGKVTTKFTGSSAASDVLLLGDGAFAVVGEALPPGGTRDWAIAMYRRNGGLDLDFSGNGKLVRDFSGGIDLARAVARQNAKLLVVGAAGGESFFDNDVAVARFRKTGSLDDSFGGGDGFKRVDLAASEPDGAVDVHVLGNDKFVVAANVGADDLDVAIARFRPNGPLDLPFGDGPDDGFTASDFGDDDEAGDLTFLDGEYYVAAEAFEDLGVARYLQNGNLDTGFAGGDGLAVAGLGPNASGNASTAQVGKIVVTGREGSAGTEWDFATARFQV